MRRILAALALLPAAPATASAATIEVIAQGCEKGCASYNELLVTATPGERNDIRVTREPGLYGEVTITDAGAPLTGECRHPDAHTAVCPSGVAHLYLGDGDDRAVGASLVLGEAGDDILEVTRHGRGGSGNDRLSSTGSDSPQLFGDDGDDVLSDADGPSHLEPGPGRDVVLAGDGDDVVYDADSVPDHIEGGSGANVLSLYPRTAPGFVDLSTQTTGDGDAISGFNDAAGGTGDDLLVGHAGDNRLYGDTGEDEIVGGAGQDILEGGGGFDTYDGGPGHDHLLAVSTGHNYDFITHGGPEFDAVTEPIACGSGRDEVNTFGDVIARDCERLDGNAPPRPVAIRGRRVTFRIPCFARGCRGTLTVTRPGSTYSSSPDPRARFRIRRRSGRVTVRLDSRYCTCLSYEVRVVLRNGPERSISSWILPAKRAPGVR